MQSLQGDIPPASEAASTKHDEQVCTLPDEKLLMSATAYMLDPLYRHNYDRSRSRDLAVAQ